MTLQNYGDDLRLIVFQSAAELGGKVNNHLLNMYNISSDQSFIVPITEPFFDSGELKVVINETVRDKDLYMITDIGNYSQTYNMRGLINHTSPNDLFEQLKGGIVASCCHARSINVITPLLYNGRQHRAIEREPLSCSNSLKELSNLGVKRIITVDAHDRGVQSTVYNTMEFVNFFPSNTMLENVINDLPKEKLQKIVFVAPDNGALARCSIYLDSCNYPHIERQAGCFGKRRDYSVVVDGRNPIIAHDFMGSDNLEGYTAFITDDMISSGGSMFDCIDELNKRKVDNIYILVTFALFTKGIEKFEKYYREGKFSAIYTTNSTYIPKEYEECEWLRICDCSKDIANLIYNIHNGLSCKDLLTNKTAPARQLTLKFEGR